MSGSADRSVPLSAPNPRGTSALGPGARNDAVMMARVAGGLFLGAALIGAVVLSLPFEAREGHWVLVLLALTSAITGAVVIAIADRLRPIHFHPIEALATLLITVALLQTVRYPAASGLDVELLYLCPALICGYFLSARGAALQLLLIGVGYGAVLAVTNDAEVGVPRWTVTLGTLAMLAWVAGALRRRSERDLEERARATAILEATLESTADGIMVTQGDRVIRTNRRFVSIWNVPSPIAESDDRDEIVRAVIDQVADRDKFFAGLRAIRARPEENHFDSIELTDGRVLERYARPQRNERGEVTGQVLSFRDVTERRRLEERLQRLADLDSLTGLYNRRRFEAELKRVFEGNGEGGAVLLLDIDSFKHINDTVGHQGGDEVIRSMGRMLGSQFRRDEVIARLGGDELAVLLPGIDSAAAERRAQQLVRRVREHSIYTGLQHIRVTVSVGVVASARDREGLSVDDVMVAADRAMYRAKDSGRDRIAIHEERFADRRRSESHVAWTRRIRDALEHDRFVLHAQPIMDLRTEKVSRHELLVRILGRDGKLIPPGAFLTHAERYGQIKEIDHWVLGQAIELIGAGETRGERIQLEINVSGHTVADPDLTDLVRAKLKAASIDPALLTFEMTETAAIASMESARDFARAISRLGCSFALDDFGSGFGSFYYLKHFPVDLIKIDGDFVREIEDSPVDLAMVDSIVQIANRLGMRTIAEFATTDRALELLSERGVDFAQGFAVGRPMPIEEIWPSLERRHARAERDQMTSFDSIRRSSAAGIPGRSSRSETDSNPPRRSR